MNDLKVLVTASRGLIGTALVKYLYLNEMPVSEDPEYCPLNIYALTKVEAERLVQRAREAGLQTAVVRFSSVYGSFNDHVDRVFPALAAAASRGGDLRIDGEDCALDLTHVDDVAVGISRILDILTQGEHKLPPIHFVSGKSVSLLQLANLANEVGGGKGRIVTSKPRTFDVFRFVGNPERAQQLLGWKATTDLSAGIARSARDFVSCSR